MTLHTEWDFYKKNRVEFLKLYLNRFVIIVGEEVKSDHDTLGEAYQAGKKIYGLGNFMIQKVSEPEEIIAIYSRPFGVDERERPRMMGFIGS